MEAATASRASLTVGFNRRFSPLARAAKTFFAGQGPLSVLYRVNAGRIPRSHWTQDPREGGGRIVGEVCHFVDFVHFLTGSTVQRVFAEAISSKGKHAVDDGTHLHQNLSLPTVSNATIAYLARRRSARCPKSESEIIGAGRSFVIDDFKSANAYEDGREKHTTLRAQDKGHRDEINAVCAAVLAGEPGPIPLQELADATRVTFRILESLRTGQPEAINRE